MSNTLLYIEQNSQRIEIKDVSAINPSPEFIRNIERALDGSLCVDIIAEKERYDIVWEIVSDKRYRQILEYFPPDRILKIDLSKISLDKENVQDGEAKYKDYIVESISGTPVFFSSELYWQNVNIKIIQM